MKGSRRFFLKSGATGMGAAALAGLPALPAFAAAPEKQEKIVVMNPRGIQPDIRKIPMAARPATLDGKTVYIVDVKYPNTKPFADALLAGLQAKYPKTTWIWRPKAAGYMDDDAALWKEIKEKNAAAIVMLGH
jgi:hypothetical protein